MVSVGTLVGVELTGAWASAVGVGGDVIRGRGAVMERDALVFGTLTGFSGADSSNLTPSLLFPTESVIIVGDELRLRSKSLSEGESSESSAADWLLPLGTGSITSFL